MLDDELRRRHFQLSRSRRSFKVVWSHHRSPKVLIPAAIAVIAYLLQRDTAMAPVIGGVLWGIAGAMLIAALHRLPIGRFVRVQLSIFVLAGVGRLWWVGSPHGHLHLVSADQGIEWRDDGAAQVIWSTRIENTRDETRLHGHTASKLIAPSEGASTVTPQQVADAIARLKREIEQQHRGRHEAAGGVVLARRAQAAFSIRLEPLSVNQLSSWRAQDRLVVVYLLRLEYSDWHGFYPHVRYLCRFGNVSAEDKIPCPGLDDL